MFLVRDITNTSTARADCCDSFMLQHGVLYIVTTGLFVLNKMAGYELNDRAVNDLPLLTSYSPRYVHITYLCEIASSS